MRFSILVPTFRRPRLLRRNLEALALQTRRPDQVLVSLRPEEDPEGVAEVESFRRTHPELRVDPVFVQRKGIVVAENAMLERVEGDVACFLDDDAVARPFWLENLARHYERDPRVGGVAGPAIDVVDGRPDERRARHRNLVMFPGVVLDQSTRHTPRVCAVDHFRGANMSFLVDPLRRHGGFDTHLLGDCNRFELDACLGVSRQGYRLIFDPEVEVDHYEAPRGTGNLGRFDPVTIHNNAANETYVFLKHWRHPLARAAHLAFAVLVGNHPAPGLAWAVGGSLIRPFWPNPYLLGLPALPQAWRGRVAGWCLARKVLPPRGRPPEVPDASASETP